MRESPYKILGISENSTKEQIKEAYNSMVKKYHPDRYTEPHMKELAEQKMKEVNEAFDYLNKRPNDNSYKNNQPETTYRYNTSSTKDSGNGLYEIRNLINMRRFYEAKQKLLTDSIFGPNVQSRGAEWYFLMGVVQMNLGEYEEAEENLRYATVLDPNNWEYRQAYNQSTSNSFFSRRAGYAPRRVDGCSCCEICAALWCADTCCECMGGDFIACC